MANDAIPINGNVVTWARERAGMSPQEAADKFAHIADWESGAAKPTYPQLEKLADDLKVRIAVFFFPEPPSTPPIRESFRTLPDVEFATIPRHVRLLLRKAKAFQLNLSELAPQGRNPAQRLITRELRFGTEANLEDMSRRVRDWLGVSIDEQMAWSDDDTALKTWRDVLQRAGVFVFKDAFRVEGFSGFSLYDDEFPIIFVNNSNAKTPNIHTLSRAGASTFSDERDRQGQR